ncbi:MBL fold metallo-hydrolase [Rhodobacterales bacterium]|nr:MBL fold metallo-hydrolase [Rhodobacterales bacterium]
MLTLGAATISKVTDLDPFVLPVDLLFPGRSLDNLRGEADVLAPDHVDFDGANILLGLHSFVLQVGGLNILIDSCVGELKPRPRRGDWNERQDTGYLKRLAQCGLTPEDVDVVMCTHLHADHVGWNTRLENGRWVPTFPNARYVIGRKELVHWQEQERVSPGEHNHGAYADSVLPLVEAGLVEPVDDGFSLAKGLEIVPLDGHSPGQIGLELVHGPQERALFCGDAIHSPVQVFRPEWSSCFCFDPARAADVRRGLLQRSAEEGLLLLPAHLRGCCGLRAKPEGARYRPEFT